MKKLYTSVLGISSGTISLFTDFETDGEMWTGEGPRERIVSVVFDNEYKLPPTVHVSLSMIDAANWANQRWEMSVQDISEHGFDISFKTWGDTRIARASATWMAIGEVKGDGDWQI